MRGRVYRCTVGLPAARLSFVMPEPTSSPPPSALPPLAKGTLYLVATPIGNLEDITLRAIRTLRECDLVAAEDTRRSGQLLRHLGISKRMISCFAHNERRRADEVVSLLRTGGIVALVSDAGTPGISDPGERLARCVLEAGFRVESVPGPCALVSALTASGLPTGEFHFIGFLPTKSGQRSRRLGEILRLPGTLVIYESPYRVEKLLVELASLVPQRAVVMARELTKRHEEYLRGTAETLLQVWKERPRKGEFVVMIAPALEGDNEMECTSAPETELASPESEESVIADGE